MVPALNFCRLLGLRRAVASWYGAGCRDPAQDVAAFKAGQGQVLIGTPGRLADLMRRCTSLETRRLEVLPSLGITLMGFPAPFGSWCTEPSVATTHLLTTTRWFTIRLLFTYRPSHSAVLGVSQMLVLDEADRLLDMGFQAQLDQIMGRLPRQRRTGAGPISWTGSGGPSQVITEPPAVLSAAPLQHPALCPPAQASSRRRRRRRWRRWRGRGCATLCASTSRCRGRRSTPRLRAHPHRRTGRERPAV